MQHVQDIESTEASSVNLAAIVGIVLFLTAAVLIIMYSQSFILMMIGVPLCLMCSVGTGFWMTGDEES